jgi:pentatricopeptide repeat protein
LLDPDTAWNNGDIGGDGLDERGTTVGDDILRQPLEPSISMSQGEVSDLPNNPFAEPKYSESRHASPEKRWQTRATERLSEEEQDFAADWEQPVGTYRDIIPEALIHQDGERLLNTLFEASDDLEYIRSIPPTTFSQMLRLLEPNEYFGNLAVKRLGISSVAAEAYQMLNPDLWQQYSEHIASLRCIIDARRQAKLPLSLLDVKSLLRCASQAGHGQFADTVWDMMKADDIKPDTAAWNLYLRARIDNHHLKWDWDHSLRSTKKHLYRRVYFQQRRDKHPDYYPGYSVGRNGIKEQVTRLFADMMNDGQVADEETYTLLMTAYGREGDTKEVDDVLMKAWALMCKR